MRSLAAASPTREASDQVAGGTPPDWGRVIGLPVNIADLPSMSSAILAYAARGVPGYVCVANVHVLTTARTDASMRSAVEGATYVVSDGNPLVWTLRRQGFENSAQVRGVNLMLRLCRQAPAHGIPVYFFGGDEALLESLQSRLRQDFPDLAVAGIEAPPLLPDQPPLDEETCRRVNASGARIVFVGLGCPKQERWMHVHSPHIDAILIGVGQAFGIAAGHVAEAPGWMQRIGLEWFFRLVTEPGRLWRRYLVGNTLFLVFSAADLLRRKPS